jgi:hypothetical protein
MLGCRFAIAREARGFTTIRAYEGAGIHGVLTEGDLAAADRAFVGKLEELLESIPA